MRKILRSLPAPEGDLVGRELLDRIEEIRGPFETFLKAVFASGITEKQGWLTLPRVRDLLKYGRFEGTELTPDTRAIVFAYHGFAPGNEMGVFSRVGFLDGDQGEVARSALREMPGSAYFSGWETPRGVGEVLRPVLIAMAHGTLVDNGDSVFVHFEDPNFLEFDGGKARGRRSEWVASDKLFGVARLETLAGNWPEEIRPFFSELRYQGQDSELPYNNNSKCIRVLQNPPLFR